MSAESKKKAGEDLVKQDLISREDLDRARAEEEKSGTPWYKQLLHMHKIPFSAVEDVLRYEFHPKSTRAEHASLGDQLVEAGFLKQQQLEEALAEQKRNGRLLGNILLERGFVSREAIARILASQHGLEFSRLEETPSDPEALEAMPEGMALKNEMLPFFIEGDKLSVLITSPQKQAALKNAGVLLGKRMHAVLTAAEDLHEEIERRYDELAAGEIASKETDITEVETQVKPVDTPPVTNPDPTATQTETEDVPEKNNEMVLDERDVARFDEIAREASGASVVKMVRTILEGAVNSNATDIHLDPQEPETRVRYRIDGILHDVMSIPAKIENAVISRVKIIADLDITETRHPQDGHISMEIGDREFDVRVATMPTFLGERVVLRLLDQTAVLSGIKDLGLETEDQKRLSRLIDEPYGMILVTGPTGSGKTTTLYSALNQKNVMTDSIVTLEDPVEYQLSGINQVQIDADIGRSFANTLRAALRQDIDVLLVGEIRDMETARIAIRAAMTGHLVFSTLHTNDAPEAISTLRNMDVPSYLIASALTAVLAQRLVRTICTNCKTSFAPTQTLLKSIGLTSATKKLYRGKGCDMCYGTGNRGRTGIFEIVEVTPAIRKLIANDAPTGEVQKAAKLKTMAMRCRQKVKRGEVTPEEFLRVIRT